MKTLKTLVFLFAAILVISCSDGGNKFVGKWEYNGGNVVTIEKDGKTYKVYQENAMDLGIFDYDEENDALVQEEGKQSIYVVYDENTKNIIMRYGGLQGRGFEFIKVQ